MRRFGLHVGILFLTFLCGVAASGLLKRYFREHRVSVSSRSLQSDNRPRFVYVSSFVLESDYHIYRYRTTTSHDPQEITLFGDFRSAEMTYELFRSNFTASAVNRIESGPKFDVNGHQVGKRGVTVFKDGGGARIFWTNGDTFWIVQAQSLELAREFEESDIVQSITSPTPARSGLVAD